SLVTSTTSLTSARLTTSTLCVTCAGLAAATSALRRPALTVVGSSTVTRTSSAKLGEPGSAAPPAFERPRFVERHAEPAGQPFQEILGREPGIEIRRQVVEGGKDGRQGRVEGRDEAL